MTLDRHSQQVNLCLVNSFTTFCARHHHAPAKALLAYATRLQYYVAKARALCAMLVCITLLKPYCAANTSGSHANHFLSPHSRRRRPLLNSSHFRSYAATATIALSGPPSPRMLVNKAVKMLYTLAARKQDVQLKTPTLRPLWRTCDKSQSSTFYRPCGTNVCHTIACADDKHCQITCALLAPR